MKRYKLSLVSLIFSCGTIVALFIINREIALRYLSSDGKTKALFGIIEIFSFSYKYFFIIPAIFSLSTAFLAIKKREFK
jgi:hypothetical protein